MRHRAPRAVLLLIGVAALIRPVVAFAGWQTFAEPVNDFETLAS